MSERPLTVLIIWNILSLSFTRIPFVSHFRLNKYTKSQQNFSNPRLEMKIVYIRNLVIGFGFKKNPKAYVTKPFLGFFAAAAGC